MGRRTKLAIPADVEPSPLPDSCMFFSTIWSFPRLKPLSFFPHLPHNNACYKKSNTHSKETDSQERIGSFTDNLQPQERACHELSAPPDEKGNNDFFGCHLSSTLHLETVFPLYRLALGLPVAFPSPWDFSNQDRAVHLKGTGGEAGTGGRSDALRVDRHL